LRCFLAFSSFPSVAVGKYSSAGVFLLKHQIAKAPMQVADHELLSRLLDEHGAALVLYAQQWSRSPEDVVQEAFIQLMRQRPVPHNVVGWLYRVVRNGAVSQSRSQGRRTRHEAAASAEREAWFKPTDDAFDGAVATTALELLPMDEREVVILRLWSGLSFDEIGELIGKSTSTAHRWYETALATMRKNWSESCPPPKTKTT
jgi:RNA polymerase sigma-70 factor (ECF subfamily)